jgi:glycosyltransferase involved in cell wall biosynthesis
VPWLLWNYGKQDFAARELVIVDSSEGGPCTADDPTVTVIPCPPGSTVAQKRNVALEAANGDTIAWFDDDDWQHPSRLSLIAAALGTTSACAGATRSWFVDLARRRARAHVSHRGVIFNGAGIDRTAAGAERFDEDRSRAADTSWFAGVQNRAQPAVSIEAVLSFWLCHGANISNPARRYVFPQQLSAVRADIGTEAWGDTEAELDALGARLELTPAARR